MDLLEELYGNEIWVSEVKSAYEEYQNGKDYE